MTQQHDRGDDRRGPEGPRVVKEFREGELILRIVEYQDRRGHVDHRFQITRSIPTGDGQAKRTTTLRVHDACRLPRLASQAEQWIVKRQAQVEGQRLRESIERHQARMDRLAQEKQRVGMDELRARHQHRLTR